MASIMVFFEDKKEKERLYRIAEFYDSEVFDNNLMKGKTCL